MTAKSSRPVRAISIRQPYVELILRGVKRYEFRSRPTNIRERVYLYAAQQPADSRQQWRKARARPGSLRTGAILGTVEIVGCRWDERRDCYAYRLVKPRRLKRVMHPRNPPSPVFWRPKF